MSFFYSQYINIKNRRVLLYMSFIYKKKKPKRKKVYLSRTSSYNYEKPLIVYDNNVYRCLIDNKKISCGHVIIPIDITRYDKDLEGEVIENNVIYIHNVWEHHDEIVISCYYQEI